ncbi:DUF305 domain-containing protein [Actinomadura macrotermitis]|uniref:DUF305 domain-containing protein n=1 Tax=Actinomadura macrotermitis TaxID=2585200 RepID=A0A7K0BSA4_9ACTN|nr:DUF305 domain-containing protein [Actinomadura macrotermitis]MQY04041.1 hypothetical protein [Actinomadura macrotermitis]
MKKQMLVIGAAALIGAAACGGDDKSSAGGHAGGHSTAPSSAAPASPGAARRNDQDVMFAQMMIPHHRQAVQMSKTVLAKGADPRVKALAARIEKAQAPEIGKMSGWLRAWGASVPPEGGDPMAGMHHGGGGMPGMMTEAQLKEFAGLSGAALDKRFLTMMIEHHEGAVTMAEEEQAKGADPAAKALAAEIVKAQEDEITQMRALLKK